MHPGLISYSTVHSLVCVLIISVASLVVGVVGNLMDSAIGASNRALENRTTENEGYTDPRDASTVKQEVS